MTPIGPEGADFQAIDYTHKIVEGKKKHVLPARLDTSETTIVELTQGAPAGTQQIFGIITCDTLTYDAVDRAFCYSLAPDLKTLHVEAVPNRSSLYRIHVGNKTVTLEVDHEPLDSWQFICLMSLPTQDMRKIIEPCLNDQNHVTSLRRYDTMFNGTARYRNSVVLQYNGKHLSLVEKNDKSKPTECYLCHVKMPETEDDPTDLSD